MSGWSSRLEAVFTLTVTPPDKRFSVHVARWRMDHVASVRVQETLNQRRLCGLLGALRFCTAQDSGRPAFFLPGVARRCSYNISTTPPDATELARRW